MSASPESVITTPRLLLTPLHQSDAAEMSDVLGDEELHKFIGGRPASQAELHIRYGRLAAGSPDPGQVWLNWIVRRRTDRAPLGTVQATLTSQPGGWAAEIAWVIGLRWQAQGFATEATCALIDWLHTRDIQDITANIHPEHYASAKVAARSGMVMTDKMIDGELVWRHPGP